MWSVILQMKNKENGDEIDKHLSFLYVCVYYSFSFVSSFIMGTFLLKYYKDLVERERKD